MALERRLRPISIMLVEDSPGDAELVIDFLEQCKVKNDVQWLQDGEAAMASLHRQGEHADKPMPDLILLDLNLPKKDGREVLTEIKGDPKLKHIPVVILTSSKSEEDILRSYRLQANCYITKPVDIAQFVNVVRAIDDLWLTVVRLPTSNGEFLA